MRRLSLLISALLFIGNFMFSQPSIGLVEFSGPTVLRQGDTLHLAWAGGLQNPQFGEMDWNGDGTSDLWVFEKVGQRIIPLIRNHLTGKWNYFPIYRDAVRGLRFFALSLDWNNDGSMDVVGYRWDGLQVFINQAPAGQAALFSKPPLRCISQYGVSLSGLFVPQDDIPAFADVDHDGDMDVLTFPLFGCLEWHKNLSMETYGIPDSTLFRLESSHWGYFKEGININNISLNDSCSGLGGWPNPLHSGAGRALLAADFNADSLVDLVVSEGGSPNMAWLKNGGSLAKAQMTEVSTSFPSTFSGTAMQLNTFPAAYYADANSDGTPDLLVATAGTYSPADVMSSFIYANLGTQNQPLFNAAPQPFLQSDMIDLGSGAYPASADLNGDGIPDLVIGSSSQNGQPARLHVLLSNPDSSLALLPLPGNDGSTLTNYDLVPSLGDIDNDGDTDLIIGTQPGSILLLTNVGSSNQPVFSASPVVLVSDIGQTYAAPELFDADSDGDLDLLVGGRDGRLAFYRNTGNASQAQFGAAETNFLGQIETVDPSVGSSGYSIPRIFYNQGVPELMVGSYRGTLMHYSALFSTTGQFNSSFTLVTDRLGYANAGLRSAPAPIIRPGQLHPDVVLGGAAGGLFYYKGIVADLGSPFYSQANTSIFPNPVHQGETAYCKDCPAKASWALISTLGQTLLQGQGNAIPTHGLGSGLYLVLFQSNNGPIQSPLMILN
jgi:hypothetical protein